MALNRNTGVRARERSDWSPRPQTTSPPRESAAPSLDAEGEPTLGDADAPVTAFLFADLQCSHCRNFELGGGLDALVARYVEPGRVRLVYVDFPVLGQDSWTAAQASKFVWERHPDTYWEWHAALMEAQETPESGWAAADRLVAFTADNFPTIDAEAMSDAIAAELYLPAVENDVATGADAGVGGTPTLVIGREALSPSDAGGVRGAIAAAADESDAR